MFCPTKSENGLGTGYAPRTCLPKMIHWKYHRSHFRNNKFQPKNIVTNPSFHPQISLYFLGFPTKSSHALPRGTSSGDAIETDVKATEDLMTALRASRDQVPALNVDGVCLCLWLLKRIRQVVARLVAWWDFWLGFWEVVRSPLLLPRFVALRHFAVGFWEVVVKSPFLHDGMAFLIVWLGHFVFARHDEIHLWHCFTKRFRNWFLLGNAVGWMFDSNMNLASEWEVEIRENTFINFDLLATNDKD